MEQQLRIMVIVGIIIACRIVVTSTHIRVKSRLLGTFVLSPDGTAENQSSVTYLTISVNVFKGDTLNFLLKSFIMLTKLEKLDLCCLSLMEP